MRYSKRRQTRLLGTPTGANRNPPSLPATRSYLTSTLLFNNVIQLTIYVCLESGALDPEPVAVTSPFDSSFNVQENQQHCGLAVTNIQCSKRLSRYAGRLSQNG